MRIASGILLLYMVAGICPFFPAAAHAGKASPPRFPVGVYVNVDEMHALWPHRNPETGLFPKRGEPGFTEYKTQWQALIGQAFAEIRKRVPRNVPLLPATSEDQPFALRVSFWIADMPVSCGSTTYYKYFWVTTEQMDPAYTTNWDKLGLKSDLLIDMELPMEQQNKEDLRSWVELWSRVPYLRVMQSGLDYTPIVPGDGG